MSDVKQVKVDNWGIYFLQRLKHFFNRTDYCDLTLQFQDNAQLKVHRLVLNACTEYFELLERTCEMYEDCLVMPDDLQADVVVPIVNFMYTGHLEFRIDLLERLYQTSQILKMPVLSKLLESHRESQRQSVKTGVMSARQCDVSYSGVKRIAKHSEPSKTVKSTTSNKRSYSRAFDSNNAVNKDKKIYNPTKIPDTANSSNTMSYCPSPPHDPLALNKKSELIDPRPTRYELPEELDNDNVFDNSFCNISYTCKPLMIHPENVKRYSSQRSGLFSEPSSSKKLLPGTSTVDIVECKRIAIEDNIFDDGMPNHSLNNDIDIFPLPFNNVTSKDSNQLFDQILDDGPKVTIEGKDSKAVSNLDHAKIISEVLKKYPHLVKSNKNIKLKILNTPRKGKKQPKTSPIIKDDKAKKLKTEELDYTYETDVIDSQQAAKLIAMGAENTKGPWICLICGTPGKALHFTSYYKFRRHLVDIHHEKPVSNICEYCGLRSLKRNYLLHHLYSQHGVEPPSQYNFPKCNRCNYIALTEGLLVKHKMTHSNVKIFRCNVCSASFDTTKQLLQHIQVTGHKYSADRKTNVQCMYCLKSFLREGNLYAHLKTHHKKEAKIDCIIEDSDEEKPMEEVARINNDRDGKYHHIKFEPSTSFENDFEDVDVQFEFQQRHDGNIEVTPRKQFTTIQNARQTILNPGFSPPKTQVQKAKSIRKPASEPSNFLEDINIPSPPQHNNDNEDEIVVIDNTEYIMRDNQLIPRRRKANYIVPNMIESASLEAVQPTTSIDYTELNNSKTVDETQSSIVMKKTINQPIQIVVSNEEEYKALMSSNHPILFDNDANKTLTVLTAPHNSTIESATINLESAQPNEMMIIQEDYPLNVTDAVTTNNSNIVVVYGHPVDDQNKQYQILTTEGIGSQFVQSSAIITQNYETVTTSAPVMTAHVLEPQPVTTWQDTVQSTDIEQVQVDQTPVLQNVQDVVMKPLENETNDDLSDLPEVHLAPETETIVPQETQANNIPDDINIINTGHVTQVVIQNKGHINISEVQIETNILEGVDIVQEETTETIEPIQISHETENMIISEGLSSDVNQEFAVQEPMETESIAEETNSEIIPQEEQVDNLETEESSQITENVNININNVIDDQQDVPESQAYDDIVTINHVTKDPPAFTKEAEAKIQNLTSEWSEDEYDVPEDTPVVAQNVQNAEAVVTPAEPEKLEETIENIQNEVRNHLVASVLTATNEPLPDHAVCVLPDQTVSVLHEDTVNVLAEHSGNVVPEQTVTVLPEHSASVVSKNTDSILSEHRVNIVPQVEIEECENDIPQDTTHSPQGGPLLSVTQPTTDPVEHNPETQEKISSLLNDWEDNDSQEENTQNDNVPVTENKEEQPEGTVENVPKPDNIKNLVSDWDEDEEEIKNE